MKRVLVVDDDDDMRELMSMILSGSYDVASAHDGAEGLEMARRLRPDLVILDLLMPRMHGFEMCRRLRADRELKAVKILISSSKSYRHDVTTAVGETGADGYIVKPFDIDEFKARVAALLGEGAVKVRFWGVRGSIAAPGPRTARYGGNTPCVEIRAADRLLIVDAGTGIRELGLSLTKDAAGEPIEGSLFVGHTHWDHIQGFPFFTPLYLPTSRFTIYGMHGTTRPFREAMEGQMHSTYFPVQMGDLASKPAFVELGGPVMIGPVKVSYHFLNHPGITIGFRFEHEGRVVSYISDHEPYAKLNRSGEFADKEDAAVARFVEGSDLLICEAQYTADEYLFKKGWGHSTFEDVLDLADKAGAKRVALFHHDPAHDDDAMDALVDSCVKLAAARRKTLEVFAAREGQTLEI